MCSSYDNWKTTPPEYESERVDEILDMLSVRSMINGTSLDEEIEKYNQEAEGE